MTLEEIKKVLAPSIRKAKNYLNLRNNNKPKNGAKFDFSLWGGNN